jgi:hypothetical protein
MHYLLILFFIASARAELIEKDFFQSLSAGYVKVNSDSDLETHSGKSILQFEPNVGTGFGISAETKYITVGYIFSGGTPEYVNHKMSDFKDLRITGSWRSFDFRLNYQNYAGALVRDRGRDIFYDDYRMRAKNARAHYYFTPSHLQYIRESKSLVERVGKNEGFGKSSSLFVGLNIDQRSIHLPERLAPEHQAHVDSGNFKYDSSFSALSAGPLLGGDLMFLYGSTFFRGKFGGGPALQMGGAVVPQMELAMNLGFVFFKRHMISLGFDLYMIEFRDSDQQIANNNQQSFIGYTYAFVD